MLKEYNETISDYTGRKTYDVEYRLLTKNRGYRWYRVVGKPTRRPDGSPISYVGVFMDITGQKEMLQELAQQRESLSIAPEEAGKEGKNETENPGMGNLCYDPCVGSMYGVRHLSRRGGYGPEEGHQYLYGVYRPWLKIRVR